MVQRMGQEWWRGRARKLLHTEGTQPSALLGDIQLGGKSALPFSLLLPLNTFEALALSILNQNIAGLCNINSEHILLLPWPLQTLAINHRSDSHWALAAPWFWSLHLWGRAGRKIFIYHFDSKVRSAHVHTCVCAHTSSFFFFVERRVVYFHIIRPCSPDGNSEKITSTFWPQFFLSEIGELGHLV